MSNDFETVEISNYFIGNYVNCVLSWDCCHSVHAEINTNMYVERMCRTLEYVHLQGNKVEKRDKSFPTLMRLTRLKPIDVVRRKGKISSKTQRFA